MTKRRKEGGGCGEAKSVCCGKEGVMGGLELSVRFQLYFLGERLELMGGF
jgi:hypothetical protein